MAKPNGGPAFPTDEYYDEKIYDCTPGMSLRDYFAAAFLEIAARWEEQRPTGAYSEHMEATYKGIAQRAYFMADAMLAERAKE